MQTFPLSRPVFFLNLTLMSVCWGWTWGSRGPLSASLLPLPFVAVLGWLAEPRPLGLVSQRLGPSAQETQVPILFTSARNWNHANYLPRTVWHMCITQHSNWYSSIYTHTVAFINITRGESHSQISMVQCSWNLKLYQMLLVTISRNVSTANVEMALDEQTTTGWM